MRASWMIFIKNHTHRDLAIFQVVIGGVLVFGCLLLGNNGAEVASIFGLGFGTLTAGVVHIVGVPS